MNTDALLSPDMLIATAGLIAWAVMLFTRGAFWRLERPAVFPEPESWPEIVAVIPARDEAEGVAESVRSLLAQNYPGILRIVLVDDNSSDDTANIAREAARALNAEDRLQVISGQPLPHGWTGKVWAMDQGFHHAKQWAPDAEFVLFTDADIGHAPGQLRELTARAVAENRDLVSLMVRLHCNTLPEKALIPAFVYFFRMLYPFSWVADRNTETAAAAGGIMLARRSAVEGMGGMAALKGALIDDCTFARRIKENGGSLWLGLAEETKSLRAYHNWGEIWDMIARSAYDQLGHSPLKLLGSVLSMALVFVAPPVLALTGNWLAMLAWVVMTDSFMPMTRYYRLLPLWSLALPVVSLFYLGATIHSAIRHHLGRGGQWKGRFEAGRLQ